MKKTETSYEKEKRLYLVELSFLHELQMERILRGEPVRLNELKSLISDIFTQIDGAGGMSDDLRKMTETFKKLKPELVIGKCPVCGVVIIRRVKIYCSKKCRAAAFYVAHREELRTKYAAYRAAHRKEISASRVAYQTTYRAAHREELRAKNRAFRAAHREERNAKNRAFRAAHREEINAKYAAYLAEHREEINAKKRESRKRKRLASHEEVLGT